MRHSERFFESIDSNHDPGHWSPGEGSFDEDRLLEDLDLSRVDENKLVAKGVTLALVWLIKKKGLPAARKFAQKQGPKVSKFLQDNADRLEDNAQSMSAAAVAAAGRAIKKWKESSSSPSSDSGEGRNKSPRDPNAVIEYMDSRGKSRKIKAETALKAGPKHPGYAEARKAFGLKEGAHPILEKDQSNPSTHDMSSSRKFFESTQPFEQSAVGHNWRPSFLAEEEDAYANHQTFGVAYANHQTFGVDGKKKDKTKDKEANSHDEPTGEHQSNAGNSPTPPKHESKVAGWVAKYQGKKFEIRKSDDVNSLYAAKKKAIAHFKVPKSKQGLLAIGPAYDEKDMKDAPANPAQFEDFFGEEEDGGPGSNAMVREVHCNYCDHMVFGPAYDEKDMKDAPANPAQFEDFFGEEEDGGPGSNAMVREVHCNYCDHMVFGPGAYCDSCGKKLIPPRPAKREPFFCGHFSTIDPKIRP